MYLKIKPALDRFFAALMLIVTSPLMLLAALLVALTSKGPVFFVQERAGLKRRSFNIYKFRTMYTSAPKNLPTHLLQNAGSFITPVGKFLRASSLDELPQLINILRGDMSFVGPRPALQSQTDLLAERDAYGANDVLPGLTGWAQINGRDELPIPVKAAYDGEYVRRMSFAFDLKCIIGTFTAVLTRRGVQEGAHGVQPEKEKKQA